MAFIYFYFSFGLSYFLIVHFFGDIEFSRRLSIIRFVFLVLLWPLTLFSLTLKFKKFFKILKPSAILKIYLLGSTEKAEKKLMRKELGESGEVDGMKWTYWDDEDDTKD